MREEKMAMKKVAPVPQGLKLDPDVLPTNPYNQDVAAKLGIHYDPKKKVYVDADGPVRDEFGQPL
jgi:hypothetical protein